MPLKCEEVVNEVWIDESVDPHDHLRDLAIHGDGRMEMSVPLALGEHQTIISIGNNTRTVIDQATADEHIANAYSCIPGREHEIVILAAALVTDLTSPQMVVEMRTHVPRTVAFLKVFLFGASNDAGKSVKDLHSIDDAIRMTYAPEIDAPKIPVHYHAEEKWADDGSKVPVRDREYYAMIHRIAPLIRRHPEGVFYIKHVSDKRTFDVIRRLRAEGFEVYAEICFHYMYCCFNDLFEGPNGSTMLNGYLFCLPPYKDEDSMAAINKEACDPEDWKVGASDRAMHLHDPTKSGGVKVTDLGIVCGGLFVLPAVQKSLIIDRFIEAGKLENLDAFLSTNARRIHHLPPSTRKVRYVREPWTVPMEVTGIGKDGEAIKALPFMRGQTMNWRRAD